MEDKTPQGEIVDNSDSSVIGSSGRLKAKLADIDDVFSSTQRPFVQRNRISDWVDDELTEAIRSLKLPPGTPLSEPKLAMRLNVSRAPVREALTRLADQRLVTIYPQVGTRVAPIIMSDIVEACFIRVALERAAFSRALEQPNPDLATIKAALAANRLAFERRDEEGWFVSDEHIHESLFALAGMPHVWNVIRGVKVNLDRLRHLTFPAVITSETIVDEHAALVRALEQRDEAEGLKIIGIHGSSAIDRAAECQKEFPSYFTDGR